jgi:hypothetical protein
VAWTYSGNPASSTNDAVRFELGDTESEAPMLEDAEVEYAISWEAKGSPPNQPEILAAAAHCMEALHRRFARRADTVTGSLRIAAAKRATTYKEAAEQLRRRAQGFHAPFAGGQSEAEKEKRAEEEDLPQPLFRREEFKIPFNGPQTPPFPAGQESESEN